MNPPAEANVARPAQESVESTQARVALIGNPNTGKSTLFNLISGLRQHVGNYPGVTVEKKTGEFRLGDRRIELVDLPGTYSLAAKSPDEMVVLEVLAGWQKDVGPIDLILCVVDASNLTRNLYLASQLAELGLPMVVALNMSDVARRQGITIDVEKLGQALNAPVVPTEAHQKRGLDSLLAQISSSLDNRQAPATHAFPTDAAAVIDEIAQSIEDHGEPHQQRFSRFFAQRLLFDRSREIWSGRMAQPILDCVNACAARLEQNNIRIVSLESLTRYSAIENQLQGLIQQPAQPGQETVSDRIDRVLTHRLWGSGIFFLLMLFVFQAIFSWSGPFMDLTDWIFGALGQAVGSWIPAGALNSLVVDGIIGGVGGVLVFLPQIFALFFFIAILEDCGYMARAAYLMDKLMSRVGLSGKSFIPLLSSFACAIPGVMAARTIENPRDRLITILIAPLMSCSARLPVYTLFIAAFIPDNPLLGRLVTLQGMTMFAMYFVGAAAAVLVAWLLRRTLLRGQTPSFVMELPAYKWPSIANVVRRMLERGWAFIARAGTLILTVSIVIWALTYFPRDAQLESDVRGDYATRIADLERENVAEVEIEQLRAECDQAVAAAHLRTSYLGQFGRIVEPVVKPLGWDWRIACGAIASFPAREVVVGTLGVIFSVGDEAENSTLSEKLRQARWEGSDRPLFTVPTALSIMVFFALCAQCAATLVTIKRETNSWRWPAFTFIYMTLLAYGGAFLVYQLGSLIGL